MCPPTCGRRWRNEQNCDPSASAGPASAMTTLAMDNIGQLATCDQDGALVVRADSAVVVEDGRIAAITHAGAADADERIDAGGRAVIPGFVDSHTHLVFA